MTQTLSMNRGLSAQVGHDNHEGMLTTKAVSHNSKAFNEAEFQKLQRQFRILESDRKSYSLETKSILNKQKETIDTMKKENTQLQEQIRLLQTMTDVKFSVVKGHKLSPEDQREQYYKKIKGLLTEIEEMDQIIVKKAQDVEVQRSKIGNVNAASENFDSIEKQIKIMENKLEKALFKYNKSLATNKRFRDSIDDLRRERSTFDKIAKKFQREIHAQKKKMSDLIEQSNSAYEARDEAQARLMTLKEKTEKEYQAYTQEIKELDRTIEHDRKLQEFLLAKAVDRVERESQESSRKVSKAIKDRTTQNQTSLESLNALIETYDNTIKELEQKTGLSDINEVVEYYKSVEECNFSLFIYVNEINNEVEKLANEHAAMQEKIQLVTKQQEFNDTQRNMNLHQVEAQFNACTTQSDEYIQKNTQLDMKLSKLIESVGKIVEVMQNISSPFTEEIEVAQEQNSTEIKSLLGNSSQKITVTEENIVKILGMVETEANDIVTLNHIFNFSKKINANTNNNSDAQIGEVPQNSKVSMPLPGTVVKLVSSKPLPPLKRLTVQVTSSVGDEELDDELKIFSRGELEVRIHAKLAAKNSIKQ